MNIAKQLGTRAANWFGWVLGVAIKWLIILAFSILLMRHSNHFVRLGAFTLGVGATLDWATYNYTYNVAYPLDRWARDREMATDLLERGFRPDDAVRGISIERLAVKAFDDTHLVALNIHGVEVLPRLIRLALRDPRGPTFEVIMPTGLTLKSFEDQRAKLENGFGCQIEVTSIDCSDFIRIQFCLRDSLDSARQDHSLLETGMGHRQLHKLITSCRRFWFKSWLPFHVARMVRRQNEN